MESTGRDNKLKILFILHMGVMRGGANKSGLILIRGLKALGHDVTVLAPAEGEISEILRRDGIDCKVVPFTMAYPHSRRRLPSLLKFIPKSIRNKRINHRAVKELLPWVKQLSPDIIHSNTSVMNIGSQLAEELQIPHVTHFREFGLRDTGFMEWHIRKMFSYPLQYNIAITKEISDYHQLPVEKSEVIYNGIYSPEVSRNGKERGGYVLYVGGINRAKGIEDILTGYSGLSAAQRSRHPLWIAGSIDDDSYVETLKRRSHRLGISEDIVWLGHREDIYTLMQGATCLVVPSHSEAFGRVVAEAMFNGCPVVGKDTHGIKEQFDNGLKLTGKEIGLRFRTIKEMTDMLNRVTCERPESYDEMTTAALETVSRLYSEETYVRSVERFYHKVLKMAYGN